MILHNPLIYKQLLSKCLFGQLSAKLSLAAEQQVRHLIHLPSLQQWLLRGFMFLAPHHAPQSKIREPSAYSSQGDYKVKNRIKRGILKKNEFWEVK